MNTRFIYQKHNHITLLAVILLVFTLHGMSEAQTYSHIYIDAANGNNRTADGSVAKPYKTITFALAISERNQLPDPWHVHIRPGTYNADPAKPSSEREIFPLKLRDKMIFEGTTTAEACIIDAQHLGETQVPILLGIIPDTSGVDTEGVTIRNLTIQNMKRTDEKAGGIELQDPTVQEEIRHETASRIEGCIVHNHGESGVWSNTPLILIGNTFNNNDGAGVNTTKLVMAKQNTFSDNLNDGFWAIKASGDISENIFQNNNGNGFFVSNIEGNITHNTFNNNRGGFESNITIIGNITHNTFYGNSKRKFSGGGFSIGGMTGTISHNFFDSNSAEGGGAFWKGITGNLEVTNNIFLNNSTPSELAGESIVTHSPTLFKNNLFLTWLSPGKNIGEITKDVGRGAAVYVGSPDCEFHNNIFMGLEIAIYTEDVFDLPITHNLFHDIKRDIVNSAGSGSGNDVFFYDLVTGNAENNIDGDPRLVNPAERDFHLQANSPAINAGTNAFAPPDDFDGNTRPVGGRVDIGPFEFRRVPVLPTIQFTFDIPAPVTAGQKVTALLRVTNAQNLAGVAFKLHFDLAVLELQDIQEGEFLTNTTVKLFEVQNFKTVPHVKITRDLSTDSAGTLLKLIFNAKAAGVTTLEVRDATPGNLAGQPIPAKATAAQLEVTPAPTIKPVTVKGDVNGDGVVNILDLVMVSRHFGPAANAPPSVNLNGDNVINILDLILVSKHF